MHDLIRRNIATQATMDRFRKKKFSWPARATCIHMVRFHLVKMGHKPPALPEMRSLLAAHRALALRGWADVAEMMGTILPEIAPAEMLMGDIALLQSDDVIGALAIEIGGTIIGWHDDARGMVVMRALKIERAWRA